MIYAQAIYCVGMVVLAAAIIAISLDLDRIMMEIEGDEV